MSTDDIVPGAVVDKERRGYAPQGHLSEILTAEPTGYWDTEMNEANLVYGTVERSLTLGGKASLSEMGVTVQGGLSKAKSATFSITGVYARTFADPPGHPTMLSLVPKIHALKKQDKVRWKSVNGKWIVLETFYAKEATIVFTPSGDVNLRADVEAAGGVSVSGDGQVTWKGKRAFTIAGNDKVPFAFRGWMV